MRDVKPTKVALLLAVPVLAVLLAGVMRPSTARAAPKDIITINPTLCLLLSASYWADSQQGLTTCVDLKTPANLDTLVQVLRAQDEPVTTVKPEDFAEIDTDGGQIHDIDGKFFIIAFVSNDDPVGFYADKGIFQAGSRSNTFCGPGGEPAGFDFVDEDCDGDGVKGDGAVVALLMANGASRGEAEVRVRQGNYEMSEPYTVVGEPDRIEITPAKTTVQTGQPRCDLFSDTASFLNALQSPETTPFTVKIADDDGTALTGAMVEFTISNPDAGTVALPLAPSLDLTSSLGSIVAPNVFCGLEETGEVTLTGRIVTGPALDPANPDQRVGLDPAAEPKHARVTFTVAGPPTDMALSASPASIACDGATSSTVSANLTDADGNPAVDGNRVHWQVKALGSVNPLNSRSAAGAATTALTPLDGVTGGVVVRAWLELPVLEGSPAPTATPNPEVPWMPTPQLQPIGFERSLETTLLVACEGTAPVLPEQPGAGQQPSISPPATGTGGGSSTNWLLAAPLIAATALLMGAGLVLKRRAA
jgi:hypothetical protein